MNEVILSGEMSLIERASKALSKEETEAELVALAQESKSIVAVTDAESREVCHRSMMALVKMRTITEKRGKAARQEATDYSKTVIALEKGLIGLIQPEETRLAKLRDAWDAKIAAEKEAKVQAELARVADIRSRIDAIRAVPNLVAAKSSPDIQEAINALKLTVVNSATFEEFLHEAHSVLTSTVHALESLQEKALEREAEAARIKLEREELARLRAEQAERDRIAREAQAKADAEAKAERDRQEAIAKAERDAADKAARQALEQERQRIAKEREENERQAEITRKAQADEAARLIAQREAFERDQAQLREAQKPKPKARIVDRPSANQLIACVAERFGVSSDMAAGWLRTTKFDAVAVA